MVCTHPASRAGQPNPLSHQRVADTVPAGSAPATSAPGRPFPRGRCNTPAPESAEDAGALRPGPSGTHLRHTPPNPQGQRLTGSLRAGRVPGDGRAAAPGPLSSGCRDRPPSPAAAMTTTPPSFGIPAAAACPALPPVKLSQAPQRKAAAGALRTEGQPSATRMKREGKGWQRAGRRARGVERDEGEAGGQGEGRWFRGGWGGGREGPAGSEPPRVRGPAHFPVRAPARESAPGLLRPRGACAVSR